MRQGTWSVLLGCHSPIHSIIVCIAWIVWYHHCPLLWQVACIFLHDIGHWGKDYLDDTELKKCHGELGARVARLLFGQKGYDLVAGHNPYSGAPRSKLHDPDKYSWVIAPIWWMIFNQCIEPKLQRKGSTRQESAVMFKKAIREGFEDSFERPAHDIYLEQWGHHTTSTITHRKKLTKEE